jgi:DNA-binding SARP family transcriptional activator
LDALYHLTEHHERQRDTARALHCARRQMELEPWREEAHQQLMRLLVRSGQRSAALQQYENCRRSLADELGIEPSPETQRLYRRIRSALTGRAHNLPAQSL